MSSVTSMGAADTLIAALTGRLRLWRVFWFGFVPLVVVLYVLAVGVAFLAVGMPPWKLRR
jgi:hypothetical protein